MCEGIHLQIDCKTVRVNPGEQTDQDTCGEQSNEDTGNKQTDEDTFGNG